MYPSTTFAMVKRAIKCHELRFKKGDKDTIKQYSEMIIFGMGNILITFIDKDCEYGGFKCIDKIWLTT